MISTLLKNKWVWIGLVIIIFAGIVIYGTNTAVCEAPCL